MPTYTITELAREFDITARAIRFYEDQGLLSPSREGAGGRNRVYTPRDRTRLKLTLRGKRLGLSLSEINGLLFYPVQYEGEEMSPNVFYTGAAPNQQAIPAVEYLMSEEGGSAKRFFLLGTDYVYPRTTNKI
eukprot:gene38398-43498_t